MDRKKFYGIRAAALLKYIREGFKGNLPPRLAVTAFRVATANAGTPLEVVTSEIELEMCVHTYYLGVAIRQLEALRLGIGDVEKGIVALRDALDQAKLGGEPAKLEDAGTSEAELEFFRTSDLLKAE